MKSPLPGSSTLITSAPKSASSVAANGAAMRVPRSRMRTPASGSGESDMTCASCVSALRAANAPINRRHPPGTHTKGVPPAMLTRVDRVQAVVADRGATAAAYTRLLDAQVVREDRVGVLGARRSVVRLGASEVELLEPDGAGLAADFLAHTKGGLFAAGFATHTIARLGAHLNAAGVRGV